MAAMFPGPGALHVPFARPVPRKAARVLDGVAPPGWEQTIKKMKKSGDIDNPWALCMAGDTQIPCLNGQTYSVRELAECESDFWVYAFDRDQFMVVPGLARVRYAGIKAAYEITLDNKENIVCSGDHRWVLRDGAFIPTHGLRVGMSLMPFKTMYEKSGHERIYQPGLACYVLTHWSVMRVVNPGCTGGKFLIHHKNENPLDNQPDNLHWLSTHDHHVWHGKDNAKAMRDGWAERYATDPDFAAEHVERGRQIAKRLWDDPVYREKMTAILRAQSSHAGQKAAEVHRAKAAARKAQQAGGLSENHTIRKITVMNQLLSMYDVAVDGYHTFAIGAGVYSHNSWWLKKRGAHPAKHEEDASLDVQIAEALTMLTRQGLPAVCYAAARGERWAQAELLASAGKVYP